MIENEKSVEQHLREFKEDVLDKVSPTFCLTKWHRTTIRTDQGLSYSCHHCVPENVDREGVKEDSKLLVSPEQVQEQRRQMLRGERPKECEYCWQAEDSGQISDRILKSETIYKNHIDDESRLITDAITDVGGIPKTLEICMDNTCNFKCSYCSASYSSKWFEEIKALGPYPTETRRRSLEDSVAIPHREENPFENAFWDIWDNHRDELSELKITGGEPLLSKNLYRIIDSITSSDYTDIDLTVNSNFCPPDAVFDKFMKAVKPLEGKIRSFKVFTSAESTDEQAEYGRFGMDFELFKRNVYRFLKETDFRLEFMMAINALSITRLGEFFSFLLEVARVYPHRINLSANVVRYPAYLDLRILPQEILSELHERYTKEFEPELVWFSQGTRIKIGRLLHYLDERSDFVQRKDNEITLKGLQEDFVKFVDEHDRRRKTNFKDTFPELVPFYDSVKAGMDTPDK